MSILDQNIVAALKTERHLIRADIKKLQRALSRAKEELTSTNNIIYRLENPPSGTVTGRMSGGKSSFKEAPKPPYTLGDLMTDLKKFSPGPTAHKRLTGDELLAFAREADRVPLPRTSTDKAGLPHTSICTCHTCQGIATGVNHKVTVPSFVQPTEDFSMAEAIQRWFDEVYGKGVWVVDAWFPITGKKPDVDTTGNWRT